MDAGSVVVEIELLWSLKSNIMSRKGYIAEAAKACEYGGVKKKERSRREDSSLKRWRKQNSAWPWRRDTSLAGWAAA